MCGNTGGIGVWVCKGPVYFFGPGFQYPLQSYTCLLPQYLLHRPSLGQFVNQFVEVPDFLHEGIFDGFHAVAANDAGDFGSIWVEQGCLREEGLIIVVFIEQLLQGFGIVSCKPAYYSINLLFGAALPLHLLHKQRIDLSEGHFENSDVFHG